MPPRAVTYGKQLRKFGKHLFLAASFGSSLFSSQVAKNYTALDKESNFFKKTAQMGKSWDMLYLNMYIWGIDKRFSVCYNYITNSCSGYIETKGD